MHLVVDLSTGYSRIWRNNIKSFRTRINSNIPVAITPDSSLINDTDFIGTSQVGIVGIGSLSINNTICIDSFHGVKPNEPMWTVLPIFPNMTQTMHLWKFRKKQALAFYIYMCNWITENETR